jgi:serine/threonine protein phosphatase PrpC
MGEGALSNQLRLEVAQLTDVGRKREHNEDNMAYVIPKDEQVLAMKGALFIVADGMGGHAAGEVASEIAVDTVSNVYYMDDNLDVTAPLLLAIKRANAAIHQRAAENMLRSGMGTTCVAAVLRGNMAYIANVGDSRAYLIRQGQVRQVSLDHSWVAEQVRAGLLTEEQARTHAQRNVITRSLGTQPDVEVDVFREQIQPGDYLVLCTDGLSGLISDDELLRIVERSVPQESVYHLVERANENGGPDNITAIVVHVQEVGVEPPGVRNPVLVGGREVSEAETIALSILSGTPPSYGSGDGRLISGPLRMNSGPLASPDTITAPQPALSKARRSRLFFPTLLLIVVVVAALAGGGVFYIRHLTSENQSISQALSTAQQLISQAQNANNAKNPVQALGFLATAQTTLNTLQKNHQLNSDQSSKFTTLQNQLVAQANTAIQAYDTQEHILPLPSKGTTSPVNPVNSNPPVQFTSIALVQLAKTTLLFALGSDGGLYHLNLQNGSYQPVRILPSTTTNKILAIASGGSQLFLLIQQLKNNVPTGYSMSMYAVNQSGALGQQQNAPISPQDIRNGYTPAQFITAWGNHAFVVLSDQYNVHIIDFAPDKTNHLATNQEYPLSISQQVISVAALSKQFFLLLSNGQIDSFPLTSGAKATPVFIQTAIPLPLAVTPGIPFTFQTPVPTVTLVPTASPTGATETGLPVAGARQLVAGVVNNIQHLYINDSLNQSQVNRVIDLEEVSAPQPSGTPTASPTTIRITAVKFVQQQVTPQNNVLNSMALEPDGLNMFVLVQRGGPSQVSLIKVSTA